MKEDLPENELDDRDPYEQLERDRLLLKETVDRMVGKRMGEWEESFMNSIRLRLSKARC